MVLYSKKKTPVINYPYGITTGVPGSDGFVQGDTVYAAMGPFYPAKLKANAGTKITFVNAGPSLMSGLTFDNPVMDSPELFHGGKFTYTFTTKGLVHYHNKADPKLAGEILIQ